MLPQSGFQASSPSSTRSTPIVPLPPPSSHSAERKLLTHSPIRQPLVVTAHKDVIFNAQQPLAMNLKANVWLDTPHRTDAPGGPAALFRGDMPFLKPYPPQPPAFGVGRLVYSPLQATSLASVLPKAPSVPGAASLPLSPLSFPSSPSLSPWSVPSPSSSLTNQSSWPVSSFAVGTYGGRR